ncbi:MAG: YsnF/AvaK domain-containing protein [Janthinobacterium lividum]
MFKSTAEAQSAAQMLMSQLHLSQTAIRVSPGAGVTDAGYDKSSPYAEKGFFASIKDMFLPEEDRYAYAEGMRRGNVLLNASVDEGAINQASSILEQAGALDLDAQEASWRQSGWTGYDAATHTAVRTAAPVVAPGRTDETIKVMEEQLVVGKREVGRGGMRVRSYVVERPVEAQVTLHEERVTIERHPVNRPVTAADAAAFGEKTLEAHATREEAVVGKDVRVVEEIGLKKEEADRVETVRDTVRKTEVEVEDTSTTTRTAGTTTLQGGTGVAGAVDRTLGTNVSGTSPTRK